MDVTEWQPENPNHEKETIGRVFTCRTHEFAIRANRSDPDRFSIETTTCVDISITLRKSASLSSTGWKNICYFINVSKKKCVFVHLHHLNHGLMSTCSNTHTHTLFFSISKYFNIAYLLNSSISLSCVFAIFVSLLHSSSWSAWEHSPTRPFVLHTNCPRLESETVSLCVKKKKLAH